jgi:hypothetical protein
MSSYRFQLADARADVGIRNVARKCGTSEEFAYAVNRATRKLMKRGNFWETEVMVKLCVRGCTVVWPHYVGTVTGLRFCCYGQVDVKNNWYAILGAPTGAGYGPGYGSYSGVGLPGVGYGGWTSPVSFDKTTTPVHTQITGNTGKYLRYYVVHPQDLGKTITVYGTKFGGQPLQEQDSSGNWINGATIAAATPIAQGTDLVTRIDQVTREATQGMAYLYQYDPVTTDMIQLAVYQPNETNPQYRQTHVTQFNQIRGTEDANGGKLWTCEAMCKLQYFPVVNDRDFLFIDDFDALAYAIQASNFDEDNDPQNAEAYFAKAIRELNFESRDKNPGQTFVVKNRSLGSCRIVANPI